jgi:hypothetical protein
MSRAPGRPAVAGRNAGADDCLPEHPAPTCEVSSGRDSTHATGSRSTASDTLPTPSLCRQPMAARARDWRWSHRPERQHASSPSGRHLWLLPFVLLLDHGLAHALGDAASNGQPRVPQACTAHESERVAVTRPRWPTPIRLYPRSAGSSAAANASSSGVLFMNPSRTSCAASSKRTDRSSRGVRPGWSSITAM